MEFYNEECMPRTVDLRHHSWSSRQQDERVHNILSPRDDRGQGTDIQLMVNAAEMDVTSLATFVTHHDVFVTRRSSIVSQSSVVSSIVAMSLSVVSSYYRLVANNTSLRHSSRGEELVIRHDEVRRSMTTGIYNRKRSTADAQRRVQSYGPHQGSCRLDLGCIEFEENAIAG